LGAQIEDEDDNDFNGITIYHAATGLDKNYDTNPIVPGKGFTGEKVTVSGWSFGCVADIATTLYMTCSGFDSIKFELTGIELGCNWLTFDVELKFQTQTRNSGDTTLNSALTSALGTVSSACLVILLRGDDNPFIAVGLACSSDV